MDSLPDYQDDIERGAPAGMNLSAWQTSNLKGFCTCRNGRGAVLTRPLYLIWRTAEHDVSHDYHVFREVADKKLRFGHRRRIEVHHYENHIFLEFEHNMPAFGVRVPVTQTGDRGRYGASATARGPLQEIEHGEGRGANRRRHLETSQ